MPRLAVLATAAALTALLAGSASRPAVAAPAAFEVVDDLAPTEIDEATQLFIDGRLLASFRLDDTHRRIVLTAHVDDGTAPHAYALCGTIAVREPSGGNTIHLVDSTGTLLDVADRRFQALGAADFTFFFLADPTTGRAPTVPSRAPSPLCHPPLS